MKKASHLLLVIVTVCAFAACAGSGGVSTNPADIQGDWELTSIDGSQIEPSGEDGSYTLSFNTDSTIAGRADCNYYAGTYTASSAEEQGQVNLEGVSTTKVNCGEQSQYDSFVQAVQNAQYFQVAGGNQLVLSGGNTDKVIFNRVEAEEEG